MILTVDRARVLVMIADDVGGQIGKRLPWPVMDILRRPRCLFRHFERIQHLIYRHIGRAAGLFQGLVAAATIVDAQLLKNPGCSGVFHGQFPHSFLSGHAHRILLRTAAPFSFIYLVRRA